jgi:5-methylcytosine-specific restriction endonuclease McrA
MARSPDCPCSGCGTLLWSSATSLPAETRLCRTCRRSRRVANPGWTARAPEPRACARCGSSFTPDDRRCRVQRYCSLACAKWKPPLTPDGRKARIEQERERSRQKNRRRRAQVRGAGTEPYTVGEIAARDKFRCGLCAGRVPMGKTWPHPQSPVIDHVVPLSRGGSDLRANVQLAHSICNARKGAAGGGEQLALIG